MLDRFFRLAKVDFHPAAAIPGRREIGIEDESPSDKHRASIEIANSAGKGPSAETECYRIIVAQLYRMPSQPLGFGNVLHTICYPTVRPALGIATRCPPICRSKIGIEFNRLRKRR